MEFMEEKGMIIEKKGNFNCKLYLTRIVIMESQHKFSFSYPGKNQSSKLFIMVKFFLLILTDAKTNEGISKSLRITTPYHISGSTAKATATMILNHGHCCHEVY